MSVEERGEDVLAVRRVHDLGVELDAVHPALACSTAATGDSVEEASAVKPGGASNTVSRCDIQHDCSAGVPASSRPGSADGERERPNSPTSAPSTRPPSMSTSACMP